MKKNGQAISRSDLADLTVFQRPANLPISVVINTLNRAPSLFRTLESLEKQTYPDFEIIVVNGPSTDATEVLLRDYESDLKIIHCPDKKLGVSRNMGVDASAGEIVAFIDDDCCPEDRWLEKLASAYCDPSVSAVGGYVFDVALGRVDSRICTSTRAGDASTDSPPPANAYLEPGADPFLYLSGCNMSFRRSVLVVTGGFNEALGYGYDDVDICCRTIDAGNRLVLLEDVLVYHDRAPNSVRDAALVVRDLYPFFFSRTVFALQCRFANTSREEIISQIRESANCACQGAHRNLEKGIFTPAEHDRFIQRLEDAITEGISTGTGSRPIHNFESRHAEAFRPYRRKVQPRSQVLGYKEGVPASFAATPPPE
jgi:glycosyltransferase involved in cell wall biosynthesis